MKLPERSVVIVTDAECSSALSCIRTLGRSGYHVFAVGSDLAPAASVSRYVKKYFQTASPWSDGIRFLQQLNQIRDHVSADFILPVSDASVFHISESELAKKAGVEILIANDDLRLLGNSKIRTYERALETSSNVVEGFVLEPSEVHSSLAMELPVIVRTDNHVDESGRYKKGESWIVRSRSDWQSVLREHKGNGQRMLVQRYVDGQGSGCFVLWWHGQLICWHTHRRLAEIPWQGGVSARRQLEFNQDLLDRSQKLFNGMRPSGVAMIEFRTPTLAPRKEECLLEPFLIEINARPWGSMALSAHAHIPFVPLWIELVKAQGMRSEPNVRLFDQIALPKKLVCTSVYPGEVKHLISVFRSFIASELTFNETVRFFIQSAQTILTPGTYFDYFWRDDPMPALASIVNIFCLLCNKVIFSLRIFYVRAIMFGIRVNFSLASSLVHKAKRKSKLNIVVVCYGNRCRSPFFAMLLRELLKSNGASVASRGINVSETHVPKRFQEVFRYYGLDPSAHKAVQLSIKDMDEADEVLVMEWQHAFLLAKSFGWRHIKKIKLVDAAQKDEKEIFDPYLLNPIEADRVFASVYERAHICASRLNRC